MSKLNKKLLLANAVIASTLFCVTSTAFATTLAPVGNGATASGGNTGYNFGTSGKTLTVPDTIAINADTAGDSIDSSGGTSTVLFNGSSVIAGNVGVTNAITNFNMTAGVTGHTIELQGATNNIGSINLTDNGSNAGNILKLNNANLTLNGSVTANFPYLDTIDVAQSATVNGTIGANGKELHVTIENNGTLSLSNTRTIWGQIDGKTANLQGTLDILGNGTVSSTIGGTHTLDTVNVNGDNTTTANFNGNVNAGTINTGAGQANFNGVMASKINIGSGIVDFQSANVGSAIAPVDLKYTVMGGNVTLADGVNFFGTIDNTGVSGTTLQLNGSSNISVTGEVGSTNPINLISVQGASNRVDTFASSVSANTINVSAATVNIVGNVGATYNSASNIHFTGDGIVNVGDDDTTIVFNSSADTYSDGKGTLNFLGSANINGAASDKLLGGDNTHRLKAVNFNGPSDATATLANGVTINALATNLTNGTLAIPSSATINSPLSISNGDLSLGNGSLLTINNTLSMTGNSVLNVDLAGGVTGGKVAATGAATIGNNVKLTLDNKPILYPDGDYSIVIATAASGLTALPVDPGTLLLHYDTTVNNTGSQLSLNIHSELSRPFILNEHLIPVGQALDAIINTGTMVDSVLGDILVQYYSFMTPEELTAALASLIPVMNGEAMTQAFENQRHSFNVTSERASHIRSAKRKGMNHGDFPGLEAGTWVKLLGTTAKEDEREEFDGFRDHTYGVAVGGDFTFCDEALVGLAFSWSHLNGHGLNLDDNRLEADSYQLQAYGDYVFRQPFFVNWNAAVAYNKYEGEREVIFGDVTPFTAESDYKAWQYGGQLEAGYDHINHGFHLMPIVSLFYSHLNFDEYTEHGLGDNANQFFDEQDFDLLRGGVGLRFGFDCPTDRFNVAPEIHARYFYDFTNDNFQTTSQFTGAGPSFVTVGFDQPRDHFNVGASIATFNANSGLVFLISYDFDFQDDFAQHSGFLKLRYEW